MGHIKPELIQDLAAELSVIRQLPLIKEKKTGVFYFKSVPFLHFHDKDGLRWAHVKAKNGDWKKIEIAFKAPVSARKLFLKSIQAAHLGMTS